MSDEISIDKLDFSKVKIEAITDPDFDQVKEFLVDLIYLKAKDGATYQQLEPIRKQLLALENASYRGLRITGVEIKHLDECE